MQMIEKIAMKMIEQIVELIAKKSPIASEVRSYQIMVSLNEEPARTMVFLSNYDHWAMSVSGTRNDLDRFVGSINGAAAKHPADAFTERSAAVFDFNSVIPVPAEAKEVRHILGGDKPLEYAEKEWGGSNAFDVHARWSPEGNEWHVQWSCINNCWPVLERLIATYPSLVFDGSVASDDNRSYVTFHSSGDGALTTEEGDYDAEFAEDEKE